MHELPLVNSILETVLRQAEKNNVKEIKAIHLDVGEWRDFESEWVQRYFDYVSRDTIAEGARIVMNRIPARMKCTTCSHVFFINIKNIEGTAQCPECGGKELRIISGNEILIKNIEVI